MKPWMMIRPIVEHVMMANDKKHLGVVFNLTDIWPASDPFKPQSKILE